MGWIKSPLASTDSFTIKTGLSGGLYFIDGVSSSISATPSLIPDAIQFISPEISRSTNTINAKVDWTFTIKFTSNALTSTDYVYLTIPDDVVYDMGETLTTILTSNSSAEISNTKTTYSSGAINVIKMTSICSSSGCATNSFLTFKISWFKNPPALTTVTSSIKIDSATSSGWIIDEGTTSTVDKMFSALTVVPITNIVITPSDPTTGAATNYNVVFTADTSIPTNSYIIITIPSELSVSSTNTGGSTNLNTCSNLFDSTVGLTCTVGTDSSGQTTIKVTGMFPNSSNSGQFGTTIGLLKNPSSSGATSSFKIGIYSPSGNPVASKDINTPVTILSPVTSCSSSWATCSGTSTTCTSCTNPSDLPMLQGNTCVDACGGGYFLSGTTCYACHTSWATWSGYKDSNWLTCNSGYYFQNGYCVTECGKNTVVSGSSCVSTSANGSWSSTWATWSKSLTWCLTCPSSSSTPIVNPVDGTWVSSNYASCNTGYYVDTTTSSCLQCSSRWKDCNFSSTQWSSCWTFFTSNKLDYITFKCVSTCSTNTYYDSSTNSCPACNPVCTTCTSNLPTTCTNCNTTSGGLQLYLTDGQWVITWPKPYSKNTSNNKCERKYFDIVSVPVIILIILLGLAIVVLIASLITSWVKHRRSKVFDEAYAYLTAIEFVDRIFLLGNLWASSKIFSFAVCFMDLITTGVLGVFFYNLFLDPIFTHSPYFRSMYKRFKITYLSLIIWSFMFGVNFVRLIYSRVFGTISTSAEFASQLFFVKPLNNMANFTLILTCAQIILCIVVLFDFVLGNDAWALGVFGLGINFLLALFQLVKIFQTQRFVKNYERLNNTED